MELKKILLELLDARPLIIGIVACIIMIWLFSFSIIAIFSGINSAIENKKCAQYNWTYVIPSHILVCKTTKWMLKPTK